MGGSPSVRSLARSGSWLVVRRLALTGTPGVGKSAVAGLIAPSIPASEVAELARRWGAIRTVGGAHEVDLEVLATRLQHRPAAPPRLVVGHLAHLLPIRDVVVLRCHPLVLADRLRARGGPAEPASIQANLVAEALDTILIEAKRLGRRVWSIDTTHASPQRVARRVLEIVRRRPRGPDDRVDWLADARVTEHLLAEEPRSRLRGRRRLPRSRRPVPQ